MYRRKICHPCWHHDGFLKKLFQPALDKASDHTPLHFLALTTGSMSISIFGMVVKPNQSRLLGGRLTWRSRLPSSDLSTTASTMGIL